MRTIFTFTTVLFLGAFLHAQETRIHGKIQDDLGEPLPFATIVGLQAKDSSLVRGTTSDESGDFEMYLSKEGVYVMRYSSMGFQTLTSSALEVGSQPEIDLGVITLPEENYALEEVVVKTLRPRVVAKGGNLTVNIENSALASGSTIYDVVAQSPGVTTGLNGELSLNGKTGVRIYVNDRPLYMEGEDLQAYLQGLSSENLKAVELISNPSSRYDAEGSGAIINLQLKEARSEGLSGTFNAGSSYNAIHGFTVGSNLFHQKGKWNSRASVAVNRRGRVREQYSSKAFFSEETPTAFLEHDALDEKTYWSPSVNLGTEYQLTANQVLGISGVFNYQEMNNQWDSYGSVSEFQKEEKFWIDARNHQEASKRFATSNLYYGWDIDSLGTRLDVNADIIGIGRRSGSSFANTFEEEQGTASNEELLVSDVSSDFQIFSATADLNLPLRQSSRLEIGVKGSRVVSENQLDFFDATRGSRERDLDRSNTFKYTEDILASYVTLNHKFSDKFRLNAGLRVENTFGKGIAQDNSDFTRQYLEWFPQVSLEHKVSDAYQVNYAYQRRVRRPKYQELNPFVFYIDPYSYILGKPDLAPQFTQTYQLNQTFFGKYMLNLSYDKAQNFIGEVPFQNPETRETVFSISNLDRYRQFGLTLMAPVKFTAWWQSSNQAGLVNSEYQLYTEQGNFTNSQSHMYLNSTHTIQAMENTLIEVRMDYRSPTVYGMYRFDAFYGMDIAIKRSLLDDQLDLTVRLNDVFRSRTLDGISHLNGNSVGVNQYMGSQMLSVNARYKFKGFKDAQQRQQRRIEELNRAGG